MQPENKNNLFSEEKLQQNKQKMLQILQNATVAGVYLNENPQSWPLFFQNYLKFLQSQIGPRGECTKSVRQSLSESPELYDQVLSLLKMDHTYHIRDIYVKYRMYSPCNEYQSYCKAQEALQKSEDAYKNILDENSLMYKSIKDGIIKKRGQEHDYLKDIEEIREKYKQKIENMKKNINDLKQILDKNQNYLRYSRLKQVMKPFFQMWREADKKIGYQSIQKGDTFQKIVQTHLLPVILKRSKIKADEKYKVQVNCRWFPKSLGQIDICIIVYNQQQNKWLVKVLIECKSRLFDIREAYKQVAVLKEKGKQKLCTKMGILDLVENPQYFIVTTLPENPFHLAIQSKMKETLQRSCRNISLNQLNEKKVFQYALETFKNQKSPLDWFVENDSQKIIVLKY